MHDTSYGAALRFLPLALALLAPACTPALVTRPPPVEPRLPELAAVPASRIALPIELDFGEVFAGVEELVPRSVAPSPEWQDVGDGAQVRFAVSRGPIALAFEGERLVAQAEVEYAIRARKELLVMLYFQCGCAGESWCGGANEGRRRMTLRAETRLGWSPEWHLTAQTVAPAPQAANQCVLGAGPWSRNMTSLIAGEVQRRLGEVARRELDARVPLLTSVQSRVARAHAALHGPVSLGDALWLSLVPASIEVSPVDGRGAVAAATASFTTEARVIRGARPETARAPLPPLATGTPENAFHVAVRAHHPFTVARAQLRGALVERRFPREGDPFLEVTDARLYGSGDDVVLRIDVTGEAEGALYLRGRAQHDAASDAIVLGDLAFTPDTAAALGSVAGWSGHHELLAAAADASRFPIGDTVARARAHLTRALGRELAPGTTIAATLPAHRVTGIGTDRTGFALALVLAGHATLAF